MNSEIHRKVFNSRLYIEQHLDTQLNAELVAGLNFISYHRYLHVFKELTGESFWQYVKRLRMEKAVSLLRFTTLSVGDISGITGFETNAAFTKAFRLWLGCAPITYRKQAFHQNPTPFPTPDWNKVKTVRLAEKKVCSLRTENTRNIPQGYFKCLSTVGSAASTGFKLIGTTPDHPGITAPVKIRWDHAVDASILSAHQLTILSASPFFFEDRLPGGLYILVPFKGYGTPFTEQVSPLLSLFQKQGLHLDPARRIHQQMLKHEEDHQCSTAVYIPVAGG